jgi:hypothetical protein
VSRWVVETYWPTAVSCATSVSYLDPKVKRILERRKWSRRTRSDLREMKYEKGRAENSLTVRSNSSFIVGFKDGSQYLGIMIDDSQTHGGSARQERGGLRH